MSIRYPRYVGIRLPQELYDIVADDAAEQRREVSQLLRNIIADHYGWGGNGQRTKEKQQEEA